MYHACPWSAPSSECHQVYRGVNQMLQGSKNCKTFPILENDSAFESSRRVLCFRKDSFPGYRGVFN